MDAARRDEICSGRKAGVLLHPTSLSGRWGIGTLGRETSSFLQWAGDAGFSWWQILPANPTGYGNSPYQPLSSFAGNPLLVSPEILHRNGLLTDRELAGAECPPSPAVDWKNLLPARQDLLLKASERALKLNPAGYDEFCRRNAVWLDPWSSYASLKRRNNGAPWREWTADELTPGEADAHRMVQFLFQQQWDDMLAECERSGIVLLGDLPIYTSLDSADLWSRPDLFELDASGAPLAVAGVPPDYFSLTGQLWGNPLYRWDAHRQEGYAWWSLRLGRALELCNTVRIDHFRGFCDYWEIPAGAATAGDGIWRNGPGKPFFEQVSRNLGVARLPIVAEDLGLITPAVRELRKSLGFPGMLVLQFTLADPAFSPSLIPANTVLYTGTHDNDTTAGWIEASGSGLTLDEVVETALGSSAGLCVFPIQDILGLGSEARMNTPGTSEGNWSFRLGPASLGGFAAAKWRRLIGSSVRA